MNRILACILFIFLSSGLKAQWFNRLYANASYGYSRHGEIGGYLYLFNHFSFGYNQGLTKIETGPAAYSGTSLIFSTYKHLKNEYKTRNFLVGITTCTHDRFDVSLMMGPGWMQALEHYEFVVKENEYSHTEWVEAKHSVKHNMGFTIRGEAIFEFSPILGINLSCQAQLNSLYTDFSVAIELNFGIVQDLNAGRYGY